MRILSLDQAPNNIGWAYGSTEPNMKPQSGVRVNDDFGDDERRMLESLMGWWDQIFFEAAPDLVTCEQIVTAAASFNTIVLHKQFALFAYFQVFCVQQKIDFEMVEIYEWRKRARIPTQRPKWAKHDENWLKDAARVACAERGWLIENHHQAEAMLMLDYALAMHSKEYSHRTGPLLRRIDTEFDNKARAFGK